MTPFEEYMLHNFIALSSGLVIPALVIFLLDNGPKIRSITMRWYDKRDTRSSWKEFWRQWFAWYPIKLRDGQYVWLERVMRRYDWFAGEWEYCEKFGRKEPIPTIAECNRIDKGL